MPSWYENVVIIAISFSKSWLNGCQIWIGSSIQNATHLKVIKGWSAVTYATVILRVLNANSVVQIIQMT